MAENRVNGSAQPQEMDENEQIAVRRDKLAAMREEGNDPFLVTTYDVRDKARDIVENFSDGAPEVTVSVAGRVMTRRIMGKASFFNLQDSSGTIQVYARRDVVGDDTYARFKKWDIGDILGVKGYVFRTQTGEITIHASELVLLSKSLRPLPEKFHGLTDSDTIYRKRYLDLITNPESKEVFRRRSAIIAAIRSFLDSEGFMEVETPMLVSNAGGAAARPFLTHFNALDEDFKLRISLELYLKRLIVGGFDRVFEIGRVFRNEGIDTRHNPEFTMMELYQAYTDYNGMMDLTERMLRHVAQKVLGTTTIVYRGTEMDLSKPFERITMVDAVKKYAGIDWKEVGTLEDARRVADSLKVEYKDFHGKGDILNEIFDAYVEEHLVQPTFLMDHPVEISPLTKRKPEDPDYVERFEFYMNGWEMANAYTELNDPVDQRERFAAQEEKLAHGDEEANHTDEDFLEAMETGMPPLGGIGYGIDRLIMLLTGAEAIRDVLLFPTLRSVKTGSEERPAEKKEVKTEGSPEDLECACYTCPSQDACKAAQEAAQTAPVPEKIDFTGVQVEPLFADYVDFETFSRSDFRAVKVLECEAVPKSIKLLKFVLDDGTDTHRVILSGIHPYYEPEELVGKTCIAITNLPPRKMMGIDSCGMLISATHSVNGEERLNLLMVDPRIPAGAKLY